MVHQSRCVLCMLGSMCHYLHLSCYLCCILEVCISKSFLLHSPALHATRHCLLLALLQSPHADAAVVGEPCGGRWSSACSAEGLCCAVLLKAQDQWWYGPCATYVTQGAQSGTRKGWKQNCTLTRKCGGLPFREVCLGVVKRGFYKLSEDANKWLSSEG